MELAQKVDDVVKIQMCTISDYKLMQPTLKSISSAQRTSFSKGFLLMKGLSTVYLTEGQFHQEEEMYHQLPQLGNWSWGQGVYSFNV